MKNQKIDSNFSHDHVKTHVLYPTIKTPLRYEDASELQAVGNETSKIVQQLEAETMRLIHNGLPDPKSREIQGNMFQVFGKAINRLSLSALFNK